MADNNSLNINSSTPLTPARGGTGVSNGTNTLTITANSFINQDVRTSASPAFQAITDANGDNFLEFISNASPVNYIIIQNAGSGGLPFIKAAGSDTDVGLNLAGKGAGYVQLGSTSNIPVIFASGTGYLHNTSFEFANTAVFRTVTFPDVDGTVSLLDSNSNISANNFVPGYTTTATAAGTTTLTVASTYQQFFTGSTTQTVVLPITSTLVLGFSFFIVNNSSGTVTVESSGTNSVVALISGMSATITCILTSGTTAASWSVESYNSLTLPLSPANGGTGVSNGTNTLTITANSSINQDVRTSASPVFAAVQTPFLIDSSSNNILALGSVASAVNYLNISNSATGNAVTLLATGSDTNVGINVVARGTGVIELANSGTSSQFSFVTGTSYVHSTYFSFPSTSATRTVTFPDASGTVQLTGASSIITAPAVSSSSTLALGTAYQNALGYDAVLTVYVSVTAATLGSLLLGVGSTNTPTQQTIVSSLTVGAVTIIAVPIYLPTGYYALLSTGGTITAAISGQIAMPV